MTSQGEWEAIANRLGHLAESFLDKFAQMCRGSDYEEEALAALAALDLLNGSGVDVTR